MSDTKTYVDPHGGLRKRLEALLNEESAENNSNTPDFILANYLIAALKNFDMTVKRRDEWYGVHLEPASSHFLAGHYSLPDEDS